MLRFLFLLVLLGPTGCAVFSRPALESPPYVQALAREGVDAATVARLQAGRVLGYHDLVALGADDTLVNFLGRAKGIYLQDASNVPAGTPGSGGLHPYWGDPVYAGAAPFDFAFPDEWYDSDYWRGSGRGEQRHGR